MYQLTSRFTTVSLETPTQPILVSTSLPFKIPNVVESSSLKCAYLSIWLFLFILGRDGIPGKAKQHHFQ